MKRARISCSSSLTFEAIPGLIPAIFRRMEIFGFRTIPLSPHPSSCRVPTLLPTSTLFPMIVPDEFRVSNPHSHHLSHPPGRLLRHRHHTRRHRGCFPLEPAVLLPLPSRFPLFCQSTPLRSPGYGPLPRHCWLATRSICTWCQLRTL